MYILYEICEKTSILRIVYYCKLALKLLCFFIPILLIVKISLDLYNNILKGETDWKKGFELVKTRLIATVILFMVFPIINFIFGSKIINNKGYLECWNNATSIKEIEEANKTVILDINKNEINNGNTILECYSKDGCYLNLPTPTKANHVFLGWSTSKTCNSYINTTYYTTTSGTYLYPCYREIETEKTTPKRTVKTNNTIYVGDSRTEGMCTYLRSEMESTERCVAEIGKSLNWFRNTAISQVDSILNSNSDKTYNIVIDLGVNGLTASRGKDYADVYNELKNGKWSKHNVIVTSVTPTNDNYKKNFNDSIKSFNNNLESSLDSKIVYCDIYNSVLSVIKQSKNIEPDGLHYTKSGSREVYKLKRNCF